MPSLSYSRPVKKHSRSFCHLNGHPNSSPPACPQPYLGHQRRVSTRGPPPRQSHQNSATCRRVMLRFKEQPLLPTAMESSLKFWDGRKFGNPALPAFPRLLLGRRTGVKRGLEDAGGEDNLVLGGRVVGIDRWRSHAPPAGTRTRPTWQHKPINNVHPKTIRFLWCKAISPNLTRQAQRGLVDTQSQIL